jgi:hypothetical protein
LKLPIQNNKARINSKFEVPLSEMIEIQRLSFTRESFK